MTWSSDELARIDSADEAQIASRRGDGTLRPPVTVWIVRLGDDLYTRSVNGPDASWFRGTQVRHDGRIAASGMSKDVRFIDADGGVNDRLDEAYRTKYRRYSPAIVDSITSRMARSATLKLVPAS
ncbi:MAG TPA: DUF2255 family protein [Mycobacterium sp.]|jgi:hypothetical protein|nr:DUF2255 family protein [Mycobacterium sp.]